MNIFFHLTLNLFECKFTLRSESRMWNNILKVSINSFGTYVNLESDS